MFANNFQDMLMLKTGAASLGKNMGKMGSGSGSKSLGSDFSAVLNSLMGKVSRPENIGEKNLTALMNIEGTPGTKTNDVIQALAAVLTGQQASKSADLYVGPEGLDALGNLLEKAGFDGEKVKSFILEKKQSMENEDSTGVSLQTLLPAVGEFMKENDQGAVLDISALPYVRSALNSFGFTPEKVDNILDASTDKNQGIDVDKLLAELAPYTTAKETFAGQFSEHESINVFGHTYYNPTLNTALKTTNDNGLVGTQKATNDSKTVENLSGASLNTTLETILSEMAGASALNNSSRENLLKTESQTSETLVPAAFAKGIDVAAMVKMFSSVDSAKNTAKDAFGDVSLDKPFTKVAAANKTVAEPIDTTTKVKSLPTVVTNNMHIMNTANSTEHIMAMMAANPALKDMNVAMIAANPAMNDTNVETVLNEAAKGEFSLDQFAAKLNALAAGGNSSTEKQTLTDGFAKAFGENVHGLKKNVVMEGSKTYTSVENIDSKNAELRFDTKNPIPTLFTEKAEGMFKGNLKGKAGENTKFSDNGTAAVDSKAGENKQANGLNPGVLRNTQNEKIAVASDASKDSKANILVEKTVKEKTIITNEKSDMPIIPVKALAGSVVYGKTSEVTQTNVSDKTLPSYVTDQVAKQISRAIRNGDSEIKFHIKPPDMGRVELSIANTANGLKISILAEHSTTRDMIMNQASDLKTILTDQGIRIEKMDVGTSGDFGQSMAQARHDSDQSNKGRKQKDKPNFSIDPLSTEPRESAMNNMMATGRYTRGKLDLVA